jgi:hypothetical protein
VTTKATKVQLSGASAGFGLAAAIVALFNTVLACLKDAYRPLLNTMNSVGYHNWITQGVVDLVLFFGLGVVFSNTRVAARLGPDRLLSLLIFSVALAGTALFFWYVLY